MAREDAEHVVDEILPCEGQEGVRTRDWDIWGPTAENLWDSTQWEGIHKGTQCGRQQGSGDPHPKQNKLCFAQ